ncbi:exopolysaccharide biosynthesis polyprenyl glycosylphosphotransferase [Terribacillus aidingensis]|uniref:Exopolysaccharide biosynthesis polyprenyl glycosylphosphotransferase n=2 Tax=Terribacillus aidingensis TaxID=586416 RepID=A0A285N5P1_9BACI|nr:exopolysaccharide biosynthesis polyprenyl glycosylphosphotransferase [Terribacillus aidingensis]
MAESKQQQLYKMNETNRVITSEKKAYLYLKRLIDIVFSLIGLILLLPVFLVLAIIIKLEDKKGTVFFSQERVGKDGKIFRMYKFRSMVSNAEELLDNLLKNNEASGPMFKMKEDPRITNIGKIIRKTSLDELPQLFNVLKGDMSLVGPRPALPREVEQYSFYHNNRLIVLPGLTCIWQVSGRSNIGFEEQVELDIEYIKKQSILFDLKLIVRTVFVLFGSKDAY